MAFPGEPDLVAFAEKVGGTPVVVASPAALPDPWPGAVLVAWPASAAPLPAFLDRLSAALPPGGVAVLADLVWQTAPTAALLNAFAPAPGRDRVRPVEGYEMLVEDRGFAILARHEVPRGAAVVWFEGRGEGEKAAALRDDPRGAARFLGWALGRTPEL